MEELTSQKPNVLLAAALEYAERGVCVFPVQPGGKQPKISRWQERATDDPEQIRGWWGQWPDANIGIACGKSHLVVIDVDVKKGAQGLESWRELRAGLGADIENTPVARTPSGGIHIYFDSDGRDIRNSASAIAPGIDIRGNGGYVVAPPSKTSDGWYRWTQGRALGEREILRIPEGLAALICERQQPRKIIAVGERIPEGTRDEALFGKALDLYRGGLSDPAVEAALLAENAARCDPPLPEAQVKKIAKSAARYNVKDTTTGKRDARHTEVLSILFSNRFRWAEHRKKWLRYDGRVWVPTETDRVIYFAMRELRAYYTHEIKCTDDKERGSVLTQLVEDTYYYIRMMMALNCARGHPALATTAEEWDADPWLLNVENGTIDLRTGEIREHKPEDLITKLAPVEFDPQATSKAWDRHLEYFLENPEVRRQVQRDVGVALVGAHLQDFISIWHGVGANGKSTTARVLQTVLGDYATQAPPDLLVLRKHKEHPTELAYLAGRRLVFSVELDANSRLNEVRVKALTGGDPVTARYMFGDFFTIQPCWTLFLLCNHKPAIGGSDVGIWRRVRLIPWDKIIPLEAQRPQDEVIREFMQEAPAILNWCLAGLRDWQSAPKWQAERVIAATAEYRAEEDRVQAFLADCCAESKNATTSVADLYSAYTSWCERNAEEALGKRAFGKHLRGLGFVQKHFETTRRWAGIRLLAQGNA